MRPAVFESFSASLFTQASRTPGLQSVRAVTLKAGSHSRERETSAAIKQSRWLWTVGNLQQSLFKPGFYQDKVTVWGRLPESCAKKKTILNSSSRKAMNRCRVSFLTYGQFIFQAVFFPALQWVQSFWNCTCRLHMLLTKQLVARFEGRFLNKWSFNQLLICSELQRKVFRRDTTNLPKELLIGNLHRDVKGAFQPQNVMWECVCVCACAFKQFIFQKGNNSEYNAWTASQAALNACSNYTFLLSLT